jgi:omega-6 fatty acid desaturase (delta-12 desaturase)
VSTTLGIYLASITVLAILLNYQIPSGVVVLLSLLLSPIVVKTFIIFHDCCHQSYFKSRKVCFWLGLSRGKPNLFLAHCPEPVVNRNH